MKRLLSVWLAVALLAALAGSPAALAAQKTEETTLPTTPETTVPATTAPTQPTSDGQAGEGKSILQMLPLELTDVYGMLPLNDSLLVLSGSEVTTISLLAGDPLKVEKNLYLDYHLDADNPAVGVRDGAFTYYDPVNRQILVLDEKLQQISKIQAPQDLMGNPVLSSDRSTLYYCTASALRAWDLDSGIRRVVKELSYTDQTVSGVHWEDEVIQCRILDGDTHRTMLIQASDGKILYESQEDLKILTQKDRYFVTFVSDTVHSLVFAQGKGQQKELLPEDLAAECHLLPESSRAVTVSTDAPSAVVACYDLNTGKQETSLVLDGRLTPVAVAESQGYVYMLCFLEEEGSQSAALCRWDPQQAPASQNRQVYTYRFYTPEEPDTAGLAQCQAKAQKIGEKYGMEILIWQDAVAAQPWDYTLVPEHRVPVIQRQLDLLDQWLAAYPEEILAQTASHFTAMKLCLVRQLSGKASTGSLTTATGLQFLEGTDCHIAISTGKYAQQALFHEYFHAMETHIWGNSVAFDQWQSLNPTGFAYDMDYGVNANRDAGVYLEGATRAFVDTYSMSYPKEDRARIFENAMFENNAPLFTYPILQSKLTALCQGIREAYGLEKDSRAFPWEQYLTDPLAAPEQ